MIDPEAILLPKLLAYPPLALLVGNRIYGSSEPPEGYTTEKGDALLFSLRPSGTEDYSGSVHSRNFQFESISARAPQAKRIDRALHDFFSDRTPDELTSADLNTPGQCIQDPVSKWYSVLTYYQLTFIG